MKNISTGAGLVVLGIGIALHPLVSGLVAQATAAPSSPSASAGAAFASAAFASAAREAATARSRPRAISAARRTYSSPIFPRATASSSTTAPLTAGGSEGDVGSALPAHSVQGWVLNETNPV